MSRSLVLFAAVGAAALVVAGVLIAVSLSGGTSKPQSTNAALSGVGDALSIFGGIPQHGIVLGNPNAPVTVVEFADLQCPYCMHFTTDQLPAFVQQDVRTGKAKLEFRGLAFVGPDSLRGLRAANAAAQQNKLWTFIDILYSNQGTENTGWLSDAMVRRAAAAVPGLNVAKLVAALDSGPVNTLVQAAQRLATTAGVNSTPTLFVNGTQVSSATAAALEQAVAAAS